MTEVTRCAACCDVGGAKVLCGLVDEAGRVLARDRYLLGASREPGQMADELVSRLRMLASEAGVAWNAVIGVGCRAAVMADVDRGVILSAPNMLGFTGMCPSETFCRLPPAGPQSLRWMHTRQRSVRLGKVLAKVSTTSSL